MDRLTRWEGHNPDGTPRAVLVKRDGSWPEHFQEALQKLARYEDGEDYAREVINSFCTTENIGPSLEDIFKDVQKEDPT